MLTLANDFPWVRSVYKESSRWVHLSARHRALVWKLHEDGTFVGATNPMPDLIPEDFVVDVSWAMAQTTVATVDLVCHYVAAAQGKVEELRQQQ